MALYRRGTASMDADGTVRGTDTKWKDQLALIRVGATIVFLEQPIKLAVISDIVSDTELKAISTDGQTASNGKYVILLNDSLTVNGLAQNVAETLRYYQSKETEIAGAMDIIASLDMDNLNRIVEEIKSNKSAAESAQNQSELARDAANAARDEANSIKNQTQQISDSAIVSINSAKEQAVTSVQQKENSAVKNINSEEAAAIQAINDAKGDLSGYVNDAQTAAQTATSAKNDAQAARDSAVSAKDAAAVSAKEAKDAANSVDAANLLRKDKNLSDVLDKSEARKSLSVDRLIQGNDANGETVISSADGTKRIFVKNNGDWGMWDLSSKSDIALPVNKGGTGAKDANGIRNNIGLNEQHSPTFSGLSIRSGWPSVVLNSTSVDETYIGRRIYAENNRGNELNIFFAKESDNTDRRTIVIERPNTTERRYVSYEGGLAIGGTSVPGYTAASMNEAHQGWRNWGGSGTGTPQGGNVYGSLFTQCSQGLSAGRANNVGTKNKWYQQRFYDTSNRIFSRIQTNDSSWGGWVQLTTSAVSDERLKDVMGDMNVECALDNINRMEFKLFKFKDEHTTKKNAGATRRGVISQQIRTIDKEYTKDVGGFWHLDQTPMLLDGLAAIKALRARDEESKKRISDLESRISSLEDMIKKLIENK